LTSLTSCSVSRGGAFRVLLLVAIAAGICLAGCAARRVAPTLAVVSLTADRTGPRAAGTIIRWEAATRGGVGPLAYEFRYRLDGEEAIGQSGSTSTWVWRPAAPGSYSMRVVVRDSQGHESESAWSEPFEVAPPLVVEGPLPSRLPPGRAKVKDVFWRVTVAGGVGDPHIEFRIDDGKGPRTVQAGASPYWRWSPQEPGFYRMQAVVNDEAGFTVTTGWSRWFDIATSIKPLTTIAVLPFENLSGGDVPVDEVRASMLAALAGTGLQILDDEVLQEFMARHRMRWVGGVSSSLGTALENETGVEAILVSSVEQYIEGDPPKLAVVSRLVSAGEKAAVLWMDGMALAGEQSPGGLDLKLVHSVEVLLERITAQLADSLADFVSQEARGIPWNPPIRTKGTRRFRPQGFYRSPDAIDGGSGPIRVAVLPFENETRHLDAGRIMELHFVQSLTRRPVFDVVEPGDVREALLRSRLILDEGPSLPQAELLRTLIEVDLIIAGTVTDYEDPQGGWAPPVVGFSAQSIESEARRVGWTAIAHSRGNEGVFFFDVGRIHTAHELASRMVRQVVAQGMSEK